MLNEVFSVLAQLLQTRVKFVVLVQKKRKNVESTQNSLICYPVCVFYTCKILTFPASFRLVV